MRMMYWCTVLLEHVGVTSNGTNGRQHLLQQYDIAIITAINPSTRIDKMRLVHPDKDRASDFVYPSVTSPCQTFRAASNVSQGSIATVRR